MDENRNRISPVQNFPAYDFDVLKKNSYIYYWVKSYMDATYGTIKKAGFDLKGMEIFDIGVGRGRSLAVFKALGVGKVVGIDITEKDVSYLLRQKDRVGVELEVVTDDPQGTYLKNIPTGSCQAVSLMNMLNFLTKEVRERILNEAKRVLIPGGILIITDASKPSLMWIFNSLVIMPRFFSTANELNQLLYPLRLLQSSGSNFFYFFNRPVDFLGRILGVSVYQWLDEICRVFRLPPSTMTYVFTKAK